MSSALSELLRVIVPDYTGPCFISVMPVCAARAFQCSANPGHWLTATPNRASEAHLPLASRRTMNSSRNHSSFDWRLAPQSGAGCSLVGNLYFPRFAPRQSVLFQLPAGLVGRIPQVRQQGGHAQGTVFERLRQHSDDSVRVSASQASQAMFHVCPLFP